MMHNNSTTTQNKWNIIPVGVSDYLELVRINNIFIAMGSMLVVFYLTNYQYSMWEIFLLMVSASAILGAGNALNDYCDLTADIINRPHRVLPSGRIKPSSAKNLSIGLFITGFIAAAFVSRFHLALSVLAILMLFLYDFFVKKYPLVGNLVIAILSSTLLIFAAGPFPNLLVLFAAGYAFLLHLAREIIKDIQDYTGDIIAGVKSLPIVWGIKKSAVLTSGLLFAFLILLFLPYIMGIFKPIFLYVALFLILPATLFIILDLLLSSPNEKKMAFLSSLVKGIMILGLLALLLGKKSV